MDGNMFPKGSSSSRRSATCSVVLFFVVALSACSAGSSHDGVPPPVASSAEDVTLPFVLTIAEEINDGERLHVLAGVKANATWDLAQVVLRLTSLKEGQPVGESFFPLASLLEKDPGARGDGGSVIREGELKRVALSVSAKEFSDYQLDLLWGQEAERYLSSSSASDKSRDVLEVHDISLVRARTACSPAKAPCPEELSIRGEILNRGPRISGQRTLGVSFAWVKRGESLDLSTFVPENEEFVNIPSLELDEGASQHFNIAIDQEIPERRDGHFQPVVRVVENEHRGGHSDPVEAE